MASNGNGKPRRNGKKQLTAHDTASAASAAPGDVVAEFDPTEGGKYCGQKTRSEDAKFEYCHHYAGQGTDHPGIGSCRLHGGSSIGALTHGRYSLIARPRVRDLYEQQEQDPEPLNIIPDLLLGRALLIDFVERYDEWRDAILGWYASWQLSRRPLPADLLHAFGNVVDEWEHAIKSGPAEPTERQLADIQSARQFVDFMRGSESTAIRPHEVLDVSAAMNHLDIITKLVERIEKIRAKNAISRKEFFRLTALMGNAVSKHVNALLPQLMATTPLTSNVAEAAIAEALRKTKEEWMNLVVA